MLDPVEIYRMLQPDLSKLDQQRLSYYTKVKPYKIIFWSWAITGAAGLIYLSNFVSYESGLITFGYFFILVICLILYVGRYHYQLEKFKDRFIEQIVPRVITGLGASFSYTYKDGIPEAKVQESRLFPSFHDYEPQDLIQGKVGETPIAFNELVLKLYTYKDGKKRTNRVFEGFFFRAQLSVRFPANIWVTRKFTTEKLTKEMQLEVDHRLNESCRFYADNKEAAAEVLQPFILDKLLAVNDKMRKARISRSPVSYHFGGNELELAIFTRRKFMDPKLSRSVNSQKFIAAQTTLLNTLFELIGDLTLR